MFHLASPVMFNKIPKSSLKLQVPVFSQNWIHLSLNLNACRLVCQIVIVIWLVCYGKQNNGNLKYVLKQGNSYILWLDYNNLSSNICSGNLFLCFRPHYGIFRTLLQVWTAVFKIIYVLSKALLPECTKSYYFILKHFYMYIFPYKYKAYAREYSLAKTYTLLLKFPGKGKIFQRKKNIKSYKSHQMTYLIRHDELGNWCLEKCLWES